MVSWAAHAAPSAQRTPSGSNLQNDQPQPTPAEAAQQLQQQKGLQQHTQPKEKDVSNDVTISSVKDTPPAAATPPAPSTTFAATIASTTQHVENVTTDSSFPPLGATVQPSVQSGIPPRHTPPAQQLSQASPAVCQPQPMVGSGTAQPSPQLAPQFSPVTGGGIMAPPVVVLRTQSAGSSMASSSPDLQVHR